MAVQASWNLDSTADSLIGISRNGLAAATTDDVQPIALLACEKFGATLAMSQETIHKIQISVVPNPSPAILNFLKVSIGYKANDCVNYFGQNTAGLHFLGLACALAIIEDQYEAAKILHVMLESCSDDKRLLPTVRQLQKLLAALEPRCHRSGFTDEVVGWKLLFKRHPKLERIMFSDDITAPVGEAFSNVVDALRQLNRVGNANIRGVAIETAEHASWFAAFVKWSTGYPPSVICEDGSSIIQQPVSRVTIVIPLPDEETSSEAVSVSIYSPVHEPSELISPSSPTSVVGMMSLRMYGRTLLQHLEVTSEPAQIAFLEAIPYALTFIIHLVQTNGIKSLGNALREANPSNGFAYHKSTVEPPTDGVLATPLCPFPERCVIVEVFEMIFGVRIELPPRKEWIDIFALQHVASYVAQCSCSSNCTKKDGLYPETCFRSKFTEILGHVVQDTLALSLINNPEGLLVSSLPHYAEYCDLKLVGIIQAALCTENITYLSGLLFAKQTFKLLGHNGRRPAFQAQVLSSSSGQAVWSRIFETMAYSKHGYLSFSWHPGHILYKDETFQSAIWHKNWGRNHSPFFERTVGVAVTGPCNLFLDLRVDWLAAVQFDQLHMVLTLQNEPAYWLHPSYGQDVLDYLEKVVMVDQCPHRRDTKLHGPNTNLTFTGPVLPSFGMTDKICIVAVDNAAHLGFIAIDCFRENELVMVRGRACINCCIEQCRQFGSRVLVL